MRKDRVVFSVTSVFLLLGTGFGWYVYTSHTTSPPSDRTLEMTRTFEVTWKTTSLGATHLNGFAGKDAPYVNTISFDQPNLKELRCTLTWTDDKATVLSRCGLDALTLQVACPDGTIVQDSAKSAPRTKQGSVDIIIPLKTESLKPMMLSSKDLTEATSLVETTYDNTWVNTSFTISVAVQIGELRPLKRLRDQGNDFDLTITPWFDIASIKECATPGTSSPDSQDALGSANQTEEPLSVRIKAGPLLGYAPLVVHFSGDSDNDSRIVSYHWTFGPTTLPIVPQASYRDHRLAVLLLFMLLSTQSPLFSFVGVSLFLARIMRVESQYESTERAPTMVLGATGNYWAMLTVADAQGHTASDTVWITVLQYVYPDHDYST